MTTRAPTPPRARPSNSSFQLTDDDRVFLEYVAARMGVTNTAVLRLALRDLARRQGADDADEARKYLVKKGLR